MRRQPGRLLVNHHIHNGNSMDKHELWNALKTPPLHERDCVNCKRGYGDENSCADTECGIDTPHGEYAARQPINAWVWNGG